MLASMRAAKSPAPELFRVSGVKYFLDGAPLSGSGAYTHFKPAGKVRISADRLRELVADHSKRGEQVAFHASGQLAVGAAVAAVGAAGPEAVSRRHRIEHADAIDAADEAKLASLGVILSLQPSHFALGGIPPIAKALPPMDSVGVARFVRKSVPICLGSDNPVTTPIESIAHAMRGPTPNEALTFAEALAAHTRGGAYASQDEKSLGALIAGYAADFVVLSKDPRKLGWQEMMTVAVEETWMGGKRTFSGAAAEK
jgi:predicted amidohydrolase YtcJ